MTLSRPATAPTPHQALRPLHTVISDLNMPKMDGVELIGHIRSKSSHKHVPIMMLTTESHPEKKAAARVGGATCRMAKPFYQDQLLATVRRVLG